MTRRHPVAAAFITMASSCAAILGLATFSPAVVAQTKAKTEQPVQTVASVDLKRYVGKWYEIAHFPMFFQRNCAGDTTAQYAAQDDGSITVNNSCRDKDGGLDTAEGHATVVPDSGNAKLEVSFFRPFKGDYWIIGLDADYQWAVVGSPSRKYLWILSRTPKMTAANRELALESARKQGYTFEKLKNTPQSPRTDIAAPAPK